MKLLAKAKWSDRAARGAASIEFMLTIIIIMFVMFWIWELVMMTYIMNVLSDSAKEGVRYAIVNGFDSSGTCSVPRYNTAVVPRVPHSATMTLHDLSGMTVAS